MRLVKSLKPSQTWNAEMVFPSGIVAAQLKEAIETVQDVLCHPAGASNQVQAVIIRSRQGHESEPDHLSLMNTVISAAKRSWSELMQNPVAATTPAGGRIDVVESNGTRIYRGSGSPTQFHRAFVHEEGIYIFPSHLKSHTIEVLGLKPLSEAERVRPTVVRVGMQVPQSDSAKLDKESLAWRERFVGGHTLLTASDVADDAGNEAKNRSALASRWAAERKIFAVRHKGQSLYPAFQFKDGVPNPTIAEVLEKVPPSFTSWDLAFFFTAPNAYLDGKSPVSLLRTHPDQIVTLACAFAHPGDAY